MRLTFPLVAALLIGSIAFVAPTTAPPVAAGPEAPIQLVVDDAWVRAVSDDAAYVFVTPLGGGLQRVDPSDSSSVEVYDSSGGFDPFSLSGDGSVVFELVGADLHRREIGGTTTVVPTPAVENSGGTVGPGPADRTGSIVSWHDDNGFDNGLAHLIDVATGTATEIVTPAKRTFVTDLSADGRLALVTTTDGPVGCTKTPECSDIYLYDADEASLTDLTRATDGSNSTGAATSQSMSPNGEFVAFASNAGDLVAGATTEVNRFYRVEVGTGQIDLVVEEPNDPNGVLPYPVVTDNGDVHFVQLGPTDYSGVGGPSDADDSQLFRWRDGTTVQISTTPAGDPPNGALRVSGSVDVAGAVNAVAFTSNASDLSDPPADPNADFSSFLTEPQVSPDGFEQLPKAVRLVDTRVGAPAVDDRYQDIGPRPAGSVFELQVTGRGGIPAGIAAVALNVTSTAAQGVGFAIVYACDVPRPGTSNLNYVPGVDVAAATISALDDDGAVCIYVSAGTELIVDATGTFPDEGQIDLFEAPDRYLDSRGGPTFDGQSRPGVALSPGVPLSVPIAGRGDVPTGTRTALVTVTFVDLADPGFMQTYPCDGTIPGTSTINAVPGENRANLALVTLAADGTLCLRSSVVGHALVDVVGFVPDGSGITTITPSQRFLDTRPGAPTVDGQPAERVPLERFEIRKVTIAGRGVVPADTELLALNLTITGATTPGWARVWNCDSPRPATSNINFPAGSSVANLVVVGLAADGTVCLDASTTTHAILDATAILP